MRFASLVVLVCCGISKATAFHHGLLMTRMTTTNGLFAAETPHHEEVQDSSVLGNRREFLAVTGTAALLWGGLQSEVAAADDDSSTFESIASKAARLNQEVQESETKEEAVAATVGAKKSVKTAYDFSLPVAGSDVKFNDLVRPPGIYDERGLSKLYNDEAAQPYVTGSGDEPQQQRPRAILVVNIKQDDPVARKDIPEFIGLVNKFDKGKNGNFVVVASPTDQGYFEPDTSELIRLKLASEYGYGLNPSTVLTDKVNLLGTGAHPFWRWLEGNCRIPSGLGRIQANFEKFLLDGRTGRPLRRYPRKFAPYEMSDDIETVLTAQDDEEIQLPPPTAAYREAWLTAATDAERDTYRFQKGLNVFDQ